MPLKITPTDASLAGAHLPFEEQIAFFQAKLGNLIPTRTWRDVRHAQHDTGFMVAGAMKADLLSDFSMAVDHAVSEGKSLQWFQKAFDAIVEEHGWGHTGGREWRAKVIYQTNLATSYAAGRLAQLRDPELQKLAPYWMYVHNDSVAHPRPQHLAWNGLTLPADHPWFKTRYPPNGWGCRCRVTAVSKAQAERDGGRFGPVPDDGINAKTGEPNGIDKGFAYMPGDTVTDRVRQFVAEKVAAQPHALGAAMVQELAGSPAFARWFETPEGAFPLVAIPEADAALIGARTTTGQLSAETAAKQAAEHPELAPAEYARAQEAIDSATAKVQDTPKSLVYVRADSSGDVGGHVLVVKATQTGKAVWVTSYRRLSRDEAMRDLEVSRLLKKESK